MFCRTPSIESSNDSTSCSSNLTDYSDHHLHFFIERKNIALSTLDNLEDEEWNSESEEDSNYSRYNSNVFIVSSRSFQSNLEEKIEKKAISLEYQLKHKIYH